MQIVLNDTVLCNFDDVTPTFSGQAFSAVSTDHGYYGNGGASFNGSNNCRQNWINDNGFVPSATPKTFTALIRNNFSGVALGGVALYNGGGDGHGYQAVVDNRNSISIGQKTLQIRKNSTTSPLIESNTGGAIALNTWYRVEFTIQTVSPMLTASVYNHSTGQLLDSISVDDTSFMSQTLYPGFFHYSGTVGGMSFDNLILKGGDEPPEPVGGLINVYNGTAFVAKPVKVWNGSGWVAKPLKRWNGTSWSD